MAKIISDEFKKILVIAPHPDDEVIGCGGTIANFTKNNLGKAYLCVVTEAYQPDWSAEFIRNRKAEIREANKAIGIAKTFFLELPTVKLNTIPQKELNDKISGIIKEVAPDILLIPYIGELNQDHRLVFEASLVAARPHGNNIKKILAYETFSAEAWGEKQFLPTVYMDIKSSLKDKLRAMSCYKSELRVFPHPRSLEGLTILAKKRGAESGLSAAEAFVLIREII